MKKFTLFAACAAFALGMNAQTVKFIQNGKEIASGETITCTDWEDDGFGTFLCDPEISVVSNQNILVDITAEMAAESQASTRFIQMCCGGDCMIGSDKVVKSGISLTANSAMPLEFETSYWDDEPETPTIIADIYVCPAGSTEKIASITVITSAGDGAVSVFEIDNTLVTFSNGELKYEAAAPCTLALYGTDGKLFVEKAVSGAGSIDATGIPAGVYVYTLGNKSGKVVVR